MDLKMDRQTIPRYGFIIYSKQFKFGLSFRPCHFCHESFAVDYSHAQGKINKC